MSIEKTIENIKALKENLDDIILDAVAEEEEFIVGLNKKALSEGFKADGSPTGQYSTFTIFSKRLKGQPFSHVTLKDTGDFYDSLFIKLLDDGFEIRSSSQNSEKTGSIRENYPNALGLNQKGLEQARIKLKPKIIQMIKEMI